MINCLCELCLRDQLVKVKKSVQRINLILHYHVLMSQKLSPYSIKAIKFSNQMENIIDKTIRK